MPGETTILRHARWASQALVVGRPPDASVPLATSEPAPIVGVHPASSAQAVHDEAWARQVRQTAYEEGLQAGRQAAQAELEQRMQAQSREQSQVREAFARLQREQEALAQQKQAAMRQAEAQQASLQGLLEQLPLAWERRLQDAEEDMLALVFETLCRIVGEQAASREGTRAMLQRTVQAWHGRQPLSVHVHPDDLALLQSDAMLGRTLAAAGFSAERQMLRWVADPAVQWGGCLLRSDEGALDARLEVQLQAVGTTLVQAREARKLAQAQATATATAVSAKSARPGEAGP